MKYFTKVFSNELLIMFFSLLLFLIGVLYSDDPGFYTRENLSSGGDDFDLFIGLTALSMLVFIFALLNLLANVFLLKTRKKIVRLSHHAFITICIIQLMGLCLIALDTSLMIVFFTFDLFSVWVLMYSIGIIIIFINIFLTRKIENEFTIIKVKWFQKILIVITFIIFLSLLWLFTSFLKMLLP